MLTSYAKNWVFTLPNPTDEESFFLALHGESIGTDPDESLFSYIVFGRETGAGGLYHLQGYFCSRTKQRISTLKQIPGFARAHFEVREGTHKQASEYCKKEGDFDEYGTAPTTGNAASFQQLRDWIADQPEAPTMRDVWEEFPNMAGRYSRAVQECIELFGRQPSLVTGNLRMWQHRVDSIVNGEPDDRKIIFVIDPDGNSGKSWLTRYWFSNRGGTQFLSIGKRDDLAHTIDVGNDLFVFDIPRGSLHMLQYGVLEQLKNRMVFSPKYNSTHKILKRTPHVVVFTNEEPDMNALTGDRYKIIRLGGTID